MKSRNQLVDIFRDTVDCIIKGYYEPVKGNRVNFRNKELRNKSYVFDKVDSQGIDFEKKNTKIYVENIDTFKKAMDLGPNCLVLNMASRVSPGGGVHKGSRAQEEDLCRRSNLLESLYSFSDYYSTTKFKRQSKLRYPIPDEGGIYTPKVTIFRDALTYEFLPEPVICNVISVPGIKNPTLDNNGLMKKSSVLRLKRKIRNLFRVAIIEGHDKLVLGALGCGAYGCPAKQVSLIFKEVLEEDEFNGRFEEICFAILEDGNSVRDNNKEGNLKPFIEVFGKR